MILEWNNINELELEFEKNIKNLEGKIFNINNGFILPEKNFQINYCIAISLTYLTYRKPEGLAKSCWTIRS